MIKHIIFDFDGTLVESRTLTVDLFNELSDKYGYQRMEYEEIEMFSKLSIMERVQKLHVPIFKFPMLVREMKQLYKSYVIELGLVEGIYDLLYKLKDQDYQLGILSSNNEDNITHFLNLNDIQIFDYVYTGSNLFGKDKAIKKLMNHYKLPSKQILYVGDEWRDVEACQKIDISFIGVGWGFDSIELLAKGKHKAIVNRPHEIYEVLSRG
ncbi:HAD-IA family hydrolase [Paenibacillus gallinarum]|uniref:HAD-IA family hydrolase n=1 Tax=Paenibacillus gallinarum TaxID=2762232 RepID=A0ABR8T6A9_9BACL|nr:HAD-IA family hydrolase [Paenibacillus gallinarum]MBD7971083.1 HAD-IA family hydrolase [Paenibacillus gallinarum]